MNTDAPICYRTCVFTSSYNNLGFADFIVVRL